jgi:predicted CXXCH cytochrome family protein
MRRLAIAFMAACLVGGTASPALAGISGTDHDLSSRGWGTNQICIFCHAPHNVPNPQLVPLWNHGTTVATFTLYSSQTLNATPGAPAGVSKACLSCHDGTVALDTYGTRTGTNFMPPGSALMGTNLSNDHPVTFTYDAALASADGGLVTPSSASWVDGAHTVPLYAASLECGSCHNAHSDAHGDFLRKSNSGSALCLTCHTK